MSEHQTIIDNLSSEITKKYKTSHKDLKELVQQLKFVYGGHFLVDLDEILYL